MLQQLITSYATKHALPSELVAAIVAVESSGDPFAWNPEPHYRYLWDVRRDRPFRALTPAEVASKVPPKDFPCLKGDIDQEFWAQQASWGLMQVMGAVARERGCKAPYLTELVNPELSLEFGCLHLVVLRKRYEMDWGWNGVISAYNAGSVRHTRGRFENQVYVDKVNARLKGESR